MFHINAASSPSLTHHHLLALLRPPHALHHPPQGRVFESTKKHRHLLALLRPRDALHHPRCSVTICSTACCSHHEGITRAEQAS
ncbi:unnamed protein product [Closterium sp. NIES-54]